MAIEVIDPDDFLTNSLFKQDDFLTKVDRFDWSGLKEKWVLVRGCKSDMIPPWAFMYVTGKLAPFAKVILFGNEHDNVVVFRQSKER